MITLGMDEVGMKPRMKLLQNGANAKMTIDVVAGIQSGFIRIEDLDPGVTRV